MTDRYSIGVVGYSGQKFDEKEAKKLLNKGLREAIGDRDYSEVEIVSGLTALGIPLLAYKWAATHHIYTVGIACEKAEEYDLYPVKKKIIKGEEWGDESETFLKRIDCIVRVGGGKQSHRECKDAKEMEKPVYEYELDSIKED